MTKNVAVVFPTAWDIKRLEAGKASWGRRYRVELLEPRDVDCPDDFDPEDFVARIVATHRDTTHGVFSSSDYPGATLAAAIAARTGWRGPSPGVVLACSHKYYSRLAQREVVPEAVPGFALVRPHTAVEELRRLRYPVFVKPVKGAFSVFSKRVDSAEQLRTFLDRSAVRKFLDVYLSLFHELVALYTDFELDGRAFLAEDVVRGKQVTVEGWATARDVGILGIVDSVQDPGTGSFLRFDYPSTLDARVQERMIEITRRVIRHHGLTDSLFNVELTYDATSDHVAIVEINPRMCGQFADLYHKVDGTDGYEVALQVACGEAPRVVRRRGRCAVASSVPLRIFRPSRVVRAPDDGLIAEIEREYPGTLIWNECHRGQELSEFEGVEDGASYRYAVLNLGSESGPALENLLSAVLRALDYAFEPITASPCGGSRSGSRPPPRA